MDCCAVPSWRQADRAWASTAALLRGLHAAARGFDPGGLGWSDELADPAGGTVVCHNDVCPEHDTDAAACRPSRGTSSEPP